MENSLRPRRTGLSLSVASALLLAALSAMGEYHNFNTASSADGIIEEVRWPYWAQSTYNAIYSQTLSGSDGGSCYFYGGMPSDYSGNPPCSIIWSFWPPSGTVIPGAAVTAYWATTNMYAPPHVGEGASGKVAGQWPLIASNQWYREVFRVWRPADGTPHLGYTGRWLRDSATGNWYHIATMQIPFSATGLDGLSGFQEDFSHGNLNPRRTDYRNVYYHKNGAWNTANQFTPSVRQLGENGTCGLIESATAAFFETCSGSNYLFSVATNLPPTTGNLVMLVATNWASRSFLTNPPAGVTTVAAANNYAQYIFTIINQPSTPPYDPMIISNAGAQVAGNQLLVAWQIPATSAPQLAYLIEIFNNPTYTGAASLVFFDRDPEARQKLLDITGVSTPYVRLSLVDIFDRTNAPSMLTPSVAALNAATSVGGAVNGLSYAYYESATSYYWESSGVNWSAMPNFGSLTPIRQGAVNNPDLTLRRRRCGYAYNFNGFLNAASDGLYTFTVKSSDGAKLYVDGTLVVNWDGIHSPGPLSGWVGLRAGKHTVNIQYFCNTQNSNAGDLIDTLAVYYEGPGVARTEVPDSAWFRVPGANEPAIALSVPATGATACGSNLTFTASVTPNGASVSNVQFYISDNFWGQDATAPYTNSAFVWAAPGNLVRARLFYATSNTLDSAQNVVTTTNMTLAPWLLAVIGDHVYPVGSKIAGGSYSLIGDGLNLLSRQVSGDCTLVAHLAGSISTAPGPDGQTPDPGWESGIILRGNTNATPGTPLGNSSSRYASVYATVGSDTHFQDDTMANAGGPYWSSGLGGQRWFRIQRVGDTFTTSVSSDGSAWTPVNTNTLSAIGTTIYVGLFTYASPSQNPNVCWAGFDNVSLIGNLVGPPTVFVAPQQDTAYPGQSATFTALPSGRPPFHYQWQSNGVPIVSATNSTLTLTNLQPFSSGVYGVLLSNVNGTASASANLVVLTPPPATAQLLSNNPLAYWRLNETAGPVANDSWGTLNGTGEGSVLFGVPGVTNPPFLGFEAGNLAAQFNGISSPSDIAIPPLNVTTTNFSITGWVKCNGTQDSWSGLVFSRGSGHGVGLMVVNNSGNELRYSWNDNGNDYNASTGLRMASGQWTFVALTISPSQAIVYFATNATLRSWTNNTSNIGQTFSGTFYLGCDPNSLLSASRQFNGTLDEIAIYNKTLAGAQLAQILAASQNPSPAVNLISPAPGSGYQAPAALTLTAAVITNGHAISQVQFYNGNTLLGQAGTAPFSLAWTGVPSGAYTLIAKLVYDSNAAVYSPPVFINVQPSFVLTQPVKNAGGFSFTLFGPAGQPYTILSNTNLTASVSSWQTNATGIFGPSATATFTNANPTQPTEFYRGRTP